MPAAIPAEAIAAGVSWHRPSLRWTNGPSNERIWAEDPIRAVLAMSGSFKGFLIGIAVGAALMMLIGRLDSPLPEPAPEPVRTDSVIDETPSVAQPVDAIPGQFLTPASETLKPRIILRSSSSTYIDGPQNPRTIQPAGITIEEPAPIAVPLSDAHETMLEQDDENFREAREAHAGLEMDRKDDSWAYYMEQALQQFFAAHPNNIQFELFQTECRTSLCEIQALGYDERAQGGWGQLLSDMRQQPWYEFQTQSSWSGTVEGRLVILTMLHRQPIC